MERDKRKAAGVLQTKVAILQDLFLWGLASAADVLAREVREIGRERSEPNFENGFASVLDGKRGNDNLIAAPLLKN